jgi:signal transduction histidine kinase
MVLLVVGAATSLVFAVGSRGGGVREMGERVARHVAGLVAERFGDRAALAARVEQLHADLDVDVVVRDLDGRAMAAAGTPLAATAPDALAAARGGSVVTRPRPVPFAVAPVRDPSGTVVATVEVAAHRRFAPPGLTRPLVLVAVVLAVVAVATRPLAGRLSRPLERLTEAARRLGGGDLAARVPVAVAGRRRWRRQAAADEIVELTRAFNDMAERVQRLVRGEKELLANVSHELRSPLARLRMTLALLLPPGGADAARLVEAERDLAELERLIDDVLATARLDATGLPTRLGEVDVRALLAGLAERARHDPAAAGTSVRVSPGSSSRSTTRVRGSRPRRVSACSTRSTGSTPRARRAARGRAASASDSRSRVAWRKSTAAASRCPPSMPRAASSAAAA